MRLTGGTLRQEVLTHFEDNLINLLIRNFFRVDGFELHIPTALPLINPFIKVVTPEQYQYMAQKIHKATSENDIKALEKYKAEGYPLDGHIYTDHSISQPIIAAILAKQRETLNWLIDNSACGMIFPHHPSNNHYRFIPGSPYEHAYFIHNICKAIFSIGDKEIFDFLVKLGLNINAHWELNQKNSYPSKIDDVFIELVRATSQNNNLEFFDQILDLLTFLQDPKNIFVGLNYIVEQGNVNSLQHFLKKYNDVLQKDSLTTDNEILLIKAAEAGNIEILLHLHQQLNFIILKTIDNLRKIALNHLHKGKIAAAESILQLIDLKPTDLTRQDLYKILYPKTGTFTHPPQLIKWLWENAKIHPTQKLP